MVQYVGRDIIDWNISTSPITETTDLQSLNIGSPYQYQRGIKYSYKYALLCDNIVLQIVNSQYRLCTLINIPVQSIYTRY